MKNAREPRLSYSLLLGWPSAVHRRADLAMPWKCPACGIEITHDGDRPERLCVYRCHVRRLEWVLDKPTGKLTARSLEENAARQTRKQTPLRSRASAPVEPANVLRNRTREWHLHTRSVDALGLFPCPAGTDRRIPARCSGARQAGEPLRDADEDKLTRQCRCECRRHERPRRRNRLSEAILR